jgi:hypothetical protein
MFKTDGQNCHLLLNAKKSWVYWFQLEETARHGTLGRFQDRHMRLLSDRAKRQNDNNIEKK